MKGKYKLRIADKLLLRKLEGKGAILVEGAKWCGKTTTCEQCAQSVLYMSESGKIEQNRQLAKLNPALLLSGKKPRLIDEWQIAPSLWDSIRFESDHSDQFGLFILTGSSVPADMSEEFHSGTGRIGRLKMRPMSLWESGDSTGEVSLQNLFTAPIQIAGITPHDLANVAFFTCRGGWPLAVTMREEVVEIKLGGDNLIEEGAKTLKSLASKIDTTKMKTPSFLMVLTAVGLTPTAGRMVSTSCQ